MSLSRAVVLPLARVFAFAGTMRVNSSRRK